MAKYWNQQLYDLAVDFGQGTPAFPGYTEAQYKAAQADLAARLEILGVGNKDSFQAAYLGGYWNVFNPLYGEAVAAEGDFILIQDYQSKDHGAKPAQPGTVNWTQSQADVTAIFPILNAVEADYGLPPTYAITTTPSSSQGIANSFFGTIVNDAEHYGEGLLLGGVAGGVLNLLTNGQLSNEASQAFTAVAGTASSLVGDIESAAQIFARGLLFWPRTLTDSVGWAFFQGVADIADALWKPLVIAGGALVGFSVFALWFWPKLKPRFQVASEARIDRALFQIDKFLGTKANIETAAKEVVIEGKIERSMTPAVVVPITVGARTGPLEPTPISREPAVAVPSEETVQTPQPAAETPTSPQESTQVLEGELVRHEPGELPAPTTTATPSIEGPILQSPSLAMATPTADVEKMLGEGTVLEPSAAELAKMEQERLKTLPVEVQVHPTYAVAETPAKVPVLRRRRKNKLPLTAGSSPFLDVEKLHTDTQVIDALHSTGMDGEASRGMMLPTADDLKRRAKKLKDEENARAYGDATVA